ncbi:GntR family transcriptional regulator [Atopobium sp. oral taxon 416]|jgi:DNA-binding GntR family transcriptional regulator|uniref:GntR family transcriptional regulator n=1 Tax=Atopobium sp. oral taxon 416 TaxID=712157 RepID=UPI001BAD1A47|nr:GntR family transcriptional regulator [Atopobium sp. oral taxon 416]QUC03725.1 GntR family transcriptional regulator [Atopobium sp. oral taxon 416]
MGYSSDSSSPLHVQLADYIRDKVYSQEWPEGTKLPSEHEFMNEFGYSRGTVQKGIQILVNEGLITKVKGKGSFVIKPNIEHLTGNSLLSFAESLRMQGIDFSTEVIGSEVIPADKTCSQRLGIPLNAPVYYLRRVRSTSDGPLLYMESRINMLTCPGIDKFDYADKTLFSAIEEVSGKKLGYAKVRYGARIAGKMLGKLLNCDETAPVLNIDQICYLEDNSSTEWGNIWLPANKYVLVSVLQRA